MTPPMFNPEPNITLERLNGCARCDGDGHDWITFVPFFSPVELDGDEIAFTHWAPCPTNGDPILMRHTPDPTPTTEHKPPTGAACN